MDPILNLVAIVIGLAIVVRLIFGGKSKGEAGESYVKKAIDRKLPSKAYRSIHDLTLPTKRGTAQIDHVVISPHGVFVIETKNLTGWIFGSAGQRNWTQTIYGEKFQIQNPLRQNFGHMKAIQAILGIPQYQIHSVVVFVGDAEFKTSIPDNVFMGVRGLTNYIKSFQTEYLSNREVEEYVSKLQVKSLDRDRKTRKQHIRNLKALHDQNIPFEKCPNCGSNLVERTARRGTNAGSKFLGCSSYPKCRFTKSL